MTTSESAAPRLCGVPAPAAMHALRPYAEGDDLAAQVLACGLIEGLACQRRPLIRGLDDDAFRAMLASCLPGVLLSNSAVPAIAMDDDEYADLLALLLEHRATADSVAVWLAHAVATAALGENHLWQDMGLPSRKVLSRLMSEYFTSLAEKNVGDMKWKKFFYRQLCERADVLICKSPHCAECCDYAVCFNPES